jgi:hypothetical protein
MKNLTDRLNREIAAMVQQNNRILVLQDKSSDIVEYLYNEQFIIQVLSPNLAAVESNIKKGIPAIHGSFVEELANMGKATFATIILTADLREIADPVHLLTLMLYAGQSAIVYFSNASHLWNRLRFLFSGHLGQEQPMHLLDGKKFRTLCQNAGIRIIRQKYLTPPFLRFQSALISFQLSKRETSLASDKIVLQ